MTTIGNQGIFVFFLALSILLLYLLAPILTPFLLGALIAYLANPLVKYLQTWHIPHILSVVLVFVGFFTLLLVLIFNLFPLLQAQISEFIDALPKIISWVQVNLISKIDGYVDIETLKTGLSNNLSKTGWVLSAVLQSSYTIIEWTVNIILTPVVTFYFLRDWDSILLHIKHLLPKSMKSTILKLARQCDEVLGAFFRGQLLVMLSLCLIYGIGLTLIGLKFGLVIGIIGGLLSIVPYLGSGFVLITASITSLVQYESWESVIWVLGVFLIGQALEGYVLTPNLVGNRIGLHPVAVIFAVMAGGTLFGFFGVLLALPAAAVIMVLLRSAKEKYQARFT